jgi:methionyl-tRNA formyltransferase
MNYTFFGTPHFAEILLERLIDAGMPPSLVVTNPDRPAGRKQVLTPPPIKLLAQRNNIPILQPEVLSHSKSEIRNSKSDFAVLASYGKIISREIIDLFPKGIIVVHPSLLPKYRGATPMQSVILNGDEETGTTLILMDEKVDHGPVLAQQKLEFPISNSQFQILHDKLAELSADFLVEIIPKFLDGKIKPVVQDELQATYTKKFSPEDAFVSEADLKKAQQEGGDIAVLVDRKIRALNPEPGTWTLENGKRMKLLEAEIRNGKLKLQKIQREGGTPIAL